MQCDVISVCLQYFSSSPLLSPLIVFFEIFQVNSSGICHSLSHCSFTAKDLLQAVHTVSSACRRAAGPSLWSRNETYRIQIRLQYFSSAPLLSPLMFYTCLWQYFSAYITFNVLYLFVAIFQLLYHMFYSCLFCNISAQALSVHLRSNTFSCKSWFSIAARILYIIKRACEWG